MKLGKLYPYKEIYYIVLPTWNDLIKLSNTSVCPFDFILFLPSNRNQKKFVFCMQIMMLFNSLGSIVCAPKNVENIVL